MIFKMYLTNSEIQIYFSYKVEYLDKLLKEKAMICITIFHLHFYFETITLFLLLPMLKIETNLASPN